MGRRLSKFLLGYNRDTKSWRIEGQFTVGDVIVVNEPRDKSGNAKYVSLGDGIKYINSLERKYKTVVFPNIVRSKLAGILVKRRKYKIYYFNKSGRYVLYKSKDPNFNIEEFVWSFNG